VGFAGRAFGDRRKGWWGVVAVRRPRAIEDRWWCLRAP
jgi:hypothetical protein